MRWLVLDAISCVELSYRGNLQQPVELKLYTPENNNAPKPPVEFAQCDNKDFRNRS